MPMACFLFPMLLSHHFVNKGILLHVHYSLSITELIVSSVTNHRTAFVIKCQQIYTKIYYNISQLEIEMHNATATKGKPQLPPEKFLRNHVFPFYDHINLKQCLLFFPPPRFCYQFSKKSWLKCTVKLIFNRTNLGTSSHRAWSQKDHFAFHASNITFPARIPSNFLNLFLYRFFFPISLEL